MSLNRYFTGGLLCLLGCNPANAQTATIVLSATLLPACEAGSVGSGGAITFGTLDFGQYASLNNAISATSQQGAGSIRVKCVSGQTYAITLDGGLYGSVATRRMANIANTALTLTYNLYSDRPGGIVWDNTTGVAATGNGNDQWYPIYGCAFGTAISNNAYDLGTLSFGTLGNLASPVNVASSSGAGSIVLTCTPGMTVSVALDYGVNGGSSNQRYLKRVSGNETLAYQLYQDAAYSQVWGNGALARTIANFPASTQTYTVYARLFAVGSLPSAGNYRDTVTVTLSF
nr:spore coat protein U domain-containing protein [Pseudomonas aeruginosa]